MDLYIEPSSRGQGYGSLFLHAIERLAAEAGCHELYLEVDPVDNPRAHILYLRQGYHPIQAEPYFSHWEFVDSEGQQHQGDEWTLDMVKPLNL